jgi:Purple acid Phosphatase, N-terminal domain/Calcineurin-like phosphoesterase
MTHSSGAGRGARVPVRALAVMTGLAVLAALVVPGAPTSAVPAPESLSEPLVRLAWVGDPATTMNIRWRSGEPSGSARVRAAGTAEWTEVTAAAVAVADGSTELDVNVAPLLPDTLYEYSVSLPDGQWSEQHSFRTAEAAPGDVVAAFVADTGIAGRLDGLTTGTDQVVEELAALDVDVVLGGGDYAYFDSDVRFETQDDAIDAWLSMMQPVLESTPFMPTYGNHETLLDETVDRWVARFATPEGDANRLSYGFDVAGVHFVAIHAFEGQLSPATMLWLTQDLDAAVARGVRTIVPYLHRNVYGDGVSHPPSPSLGRQLSALFEQYPVDVVLTAHDQSYERTFPLRDGDPTTSVRGCSTREDGIVWVKTSPGGKLSNVTRGFSGFGATPPSPQIAVREGALHHITTLTAGEDGIEVVTYGVTGDGSPPIEVDRFERRAACSPALEFATQPLALTGGDGVVTSSAALSGSADGVGLSTSAPWLTASFAAAGGVQIDADTSELAPGTHAAAVVATAPDGRTASLPVVVTVADPERGLEILLSGPDRSEREPLAGATLSGGAFVELRASVTAVQAVTFVVDGTPVRSESQLPFDLGGGGAQPRAFDTTALSNGPHRLEVRVVLADGGIETVVADFMVDNAAVPPASAPPVGTTSGDAPSLAPAVSGVAGDIARSAPPAVAGTDARSAWWSSPLVLVATALAVGAIVGIAGRRRRPSPGIPPDDADDSTTRDHEPDGYVTR